MKNGTLQILAACVWLIAFLSIVGYVVGIPALYLWQWRGTTVSMAMSTAICFLFTSTCLLILVQQPERNSKVERNEQC